MKKIIFAISIFTLVLSCSKEDAPTVEQEKPINYYACGGAKLGSFSERAVFWKNGQPTFLTTGFGYANALEVLDNDIHIIGQDNGVSKYWINGVDQHYQNIISNFLIDICVSDNNVYILGYTNNAIKYWKNGVLFDVHNSSNSMYASAIKVIGNDIYITFRENGIVKLWKNGVITNLSDGNTNEDLKNLEVYNSNVYVLSDENDNGVRKIKYWKDAMPNYLTTTGNTITSYHIKVNNYGVVIGGTYNYKAGYWKNSVFYDLSTAGVNSFNYATNILDNDVFNVVSENGKAKFFKNTTLLYTDGSVSDANLNDCKVVYK